MKNYAKEEILNTFNDLLRENHIENITVNMIIKKSEISRSTFYRNFIDKYDVMNYNYKKIVADVLKYNLCKDWKDFFTVILTNSKKDSNRFLNAFASYGVNSYSNFIFNYSYELMKKTALKKGKVLSDEDSCLVSVFCYGSVWTIYDWLKNKLNLSIDVMAIQLEKTVPEFIKNLW